MRGKTLTRPLALKWMAVLLCLSVSGVTGLRAESLVLAASPLAAHQQVLQLYVGDWKIYSETLQPQRSTDAYDETYAWVLDRQFIQGSTGRRADGSQDLMVASYDSNQEGYPFWIFSSTGSSLHLAAGRWDGGKRTLTWQSPAGADVAYLCRCQFPDNSLRRCDLIVRDPSGEVLLERSWRAERKRPSAPR